MSTTATTTSSPAPEKWSLSDVTVDGTPAREFYGREAIASAMDTIAAAEAKGQAILAAHGRVAVVRRTHEIKVVLDGTLVVATFPWTPHLPDLVVLEAAEATATVIRRSLLPA